MSRANLILLVLVTLLAACGKEPQAGGERLASPIAFSADMEQEEVNPPANVDARWNDGLTYEPILGVVATRASGEIATSEALRTGGYGVFACYTGLYHYSESSVTADFMHNQQVTWDGTGWEYTPVKYWPNEEGHYVSFFAYAPFSDGDPDSSPEGYCIPSFCNPKSLTDPWLVYRLHTDPTKQVDLLYAKPILDQTKPETTYKLPFSFKHALACVGDKVRISVSDAAKTRLGEMTQYDDVQLILSRITLQCSLLEKARLTLWNRGQVNWSYIASEGGFVSRSTDVFDGEYPMYRVSTGSTSSWEGSGSGIFYIPLDTSSPQTAVLQVRYIVRATKDGKNTDFIHTGEVELTLNSYPDAFSEGKKLDIHVTLN